MIHEHALAYLLGLVRVDPTEGYRQWSESYDDGRNSAFDLDEPVIGRIVEALPVGVALDAACGTGRWAEQLAARGHRVIGVDGSPEMLARARVKVPDGEFRFGELDRLPVDDDSVDLVVCSLALTHVPALGPVLAEFARVLRPHGHLLISDVHPERVLRGSIPSVRRPDGRPARLATHRHLVGDYLRAALPVGLELRRCEEPTMPTAPGTPPGASPGPWELWPWSLADLVPDAAHGANADVPVLVVWHFQVGGE